jgi:hypothetical protein
LGDLSRRRHPDHDRAHERPLFLGGSQRSDGAFDPAPTDTIGDIRRVEEGAVLTGNLSLQAKQNDYTYRTFKLASPGSRYLFPCSPCPYVFLAEGLPFQVLIRNPPEASSDQQSG